MSEAAIQGGSILVFDSGVGGLSVVGAIRARLGNVALSYACDNAALPYGTKPDGWLVERIVTVCEAAVTAASACALVVACNTASTLALEALRMRLNIPVIGTVPAIKPAASASASGVIGLLATSATVRRPYTDRLIADFAAHCHVVRVAADALVGEAERHLAGCPLTLDTLHRSLQPLFDESELDHVVLGCTHFPLLREHFAALAPRPIGWVDSGAAIARRVESVVPVPHMSSGRDRSFATAAGSAGLARALVRFGFAAPAQLEGVGLSGVP